MAVYAILPVFVSLLVVQLALAPSATASASVEKRQAECFNPFYKPPWCYGFGFGAPGFGYGFGPGFGAGFGPVGFGFGGFGPGARGFGTGLGVGTSFSTKFGGEEEEEEKPKPRPSASKYKVPRPSKKPLTPYGAGVYAGTGFGGPFDFGDFGPYGGYGGGFGGDFGFGPGFGAGFGYNPYLPNLSDLPTVKSSGPGFTTSSGSSTYTFGPEGKTTTSTSNQMVTTKAPDGEWTIQSSGVPMETEPDAGTILVTASVGKPTKVDKELVSEREFQVNFSYKDEPKKWINLKVNEGGPNIAGVTVEQKGSTVYIRGPGKAVKPT